MSEVKGGIILVIGAIGGGFTAIFGGWSQGLNVLLICMVIDFITGVVGALMSKSLKTDSGGINSKVTWKGLIKKITTLLIVALGCQLDQLLGTEIIQSACIYGFIFNEVTSIVENTAIIGVPMPNIITKALDMIKAKENDNLQ